MTQPEEGPTVDITDIIGKGPSFQRPNHPDMDRIIEIVLEMKAITQEYSGKPEFEAEWRRNIEKTINFDSLAYQAMQVAFDIHQVMTFGDFQRLRQSPQRLLAFTQTIQAFYDGFLLGARFTERGGHREP